jgi:hypothetical protein
VTRSRKRPSSGAASLPKRLREKLTRLRRQEQQDLLRRYDERQIDDREPAPRWM